MVRRAARRNPAGGGLVDPGAMATQARVARFVPGRPTGSDELAVRRRYLRHRRRLSGRGWLAFWVTVSTLLGWLFVAGVAGLGH